MKNQKSWRVVKITRPEYVRKLIKLGFTRSQIIARLKLIRKQRIAFCPIVNLTIHGVELHY